MLRPGMMLCDRYEILDIVGAGGMSIVYKARCHRLNRNVAIKVLKPEFSNDKNFVTKFKIEAQAAAGLTHPNIVNVFDVYDDDGIYFIVMELVDGITLKEYIAENGRLSMDKAIDFSMQIAAGIEAAHESHIIHRDIKPQNIIVSKNGNIKVTDFGIAKAASPNTLTSGAMGSVHYISPEQARGGYSDERSDVYSLGITMYEMVTGRVPFDGENNVAIALMHIQNDMIPPRQYYPDIYSSFEKVILKATQKKPERRYLTASALIADLKRVQNNPNIDIVVAASSIANGPTQEWTKETVQAIRSQSAGKSIDENSAYNRYAANDNSQLNTFEENPPLQNEMGELQPIGGISPIQVNNQKIEQLFRDNPDWEEELEDDYEAAPPRQPSQGRSIKRVPDIDDDVEDDEADEGELDPKLKNAVVASAIAVVVIIAVLVILLIGSLKKGFGFGGNKDKTEDTAISEEAQMLPMIEVCGVSQDAAIKLLKDAGFENVEVVVEVNDEVQAGYVFEQSVKKDEVIDVTTLITLKVSGGSEEVDVPNVIGYTDEQACTVLTEAGFKISHAYEYSETVEKDKVIKTDPDAGSKAAKGSTIVLTISNGSEVKEVAAPNLKGLTEEQAVNELTRLKLVKGNVTHEYSDTVEKGLVISQSVANGTTLKEGDSIDFVISDGPEPKEKTYAVTVSGRITCNDPALDGQSVTVQILFEGDPIKENSFTVTAGSSFDISAIKGGLTSQAGSGTVIIIDSAGNNVTSSFTTDIRTTFAEE